MSYGTVALIVLSFWLATGIVLGVVLERRGYNGLGWGAVGAVLGPVGVLIALLFHVKPRPDETVRFGVGGGGPVDVLVGFDGSDASLEAALEAADLLGARLGRFMLATVNNFDATFVEERVTRSALQRAAQELGDALRVAGVRPAEVVLHGPPAEAIARFAKTEGFDLIAIGAHGRGASRALLGSTAAALFRTSRVPIFVGAEAMVTASATDVHRNATLTTR